MAKRAARATGPRFLGNALIVEDDALNAMALEQALLDDGAASVTVCATTAAAMAALEKLRPDVIVLDVNLADRNDGWALAELVMELTPRPPRIIFSTGSPQSIPPNIAELGIVMAKPYEPERLVEALHGQQDSHGLLSRLRDAISTH